MATLLELKMRKASLEDIIERFLRSYQGNLGQSMSLEFYINQAQQVSQQLRLAENKLLVHKSFSSPLLRTLAVCAAGVFLNNERTNEMSMQKFKDISNEKWRNYEWIDPITKLRVEHKIYAPVSLTVGKTTHRITDITGLVHCIPSVGYFGCVLFWEVKSEDIQQPTEHSCLKD